MSYQYENLLYEAKDVLNDTRIIIDSIINNRIQRTDSSLVNHIKTIDGIINNINYYEKTLHSKKRIKIQHENEVETENKTLTTISRSQDKSKINTLPDEVLSKIFKYINYYNELSDCVLVCKKWKLLATPILYKTPAIFSIDSWTKLKCAIDFSSKPVKQYLGSLIKNLNFVRLETTNSRSVESLIIYLSKLCPNIETINLSSITLDGSVIRKIIDNYPNLQHIDISINLLTEKIINKTLAPYIHKIKSLHIENDLLSNQDLISDEEFKAFTVRAKQLEEIQFDFFMSHLTVEGFNDAINQIPNLTGVGIVTEDSLNFDDELMFSVKFINDYVINQGEKLTKLFFGGSTILENTLNLVADNCPNLETFGIELPSRFATLDQNEEEEINHDIPLCYNAFLKIASKCVKIKYLEIDRLRSEENNTSYCDKVMNEFFINCNELSVLLLRESTLSPAVLETLNEHCNEKLEILEISTIDNFVNFENFPDVMQRVINNCKHLRILSLPTEDNTEYNLPEDLCLYEETDLLNIWNVKKQLSYYRYYANMNSRIIINDENDINEEDENGQTIVHRNVVPRIAFIRI
ncbi:hypothetical protein BCR32DRAFT_264365 [Anaeromyces robustus]|uniref:F-box domain-containing protein n=1 Tax=Anaeromyces robustus TaxID=1754192 RepID=A0A1Y1XNH2_9FUNG|nr:hypothetical protein BCR32DRAFT_264365 [Anaeromyces robustus]|eukprot:ORX87299.1 hypothetical protein BCR32DRAFT_264365 [Anaeromyces robustus]